MLKTSSKQKLLYRYDMRGNSVCQCKVKGIMLHFYFGTHYFVALFTAHIFFFKARILWIFCGYYVVFIWWLSNLLCIYYHIIPSLCNARITTKGLQRSALFQINFDTRYTVNRKSMYSLSNLQLPLWMYLICSSFYFQQNAYYMIIFKKSCWNL